MFMRVKTIVQDGHRYEYLQIVRAVRGGGRVRQELVASLGVLPGNTADLDGTRYRLRTDCPGHAARAFQAAGVAIRPQSPRLDPSPSPKSPRSTPPPHSPCSDKQFVHRLTT
jgi:hypothetical protein